MYSRISERAFDTLIQKFSDLVEEKAMGLGVRGSQIDSYKTGYFHSFWAMEISALDEDAQLQLYNAITNRMILIRKELKAKELELTAREVNVA